LGIAYSPGFTDGTLGKIFGGPGKTSIRASYGIYYTSIEDLNLFYEVGDAPFGQYWSSPQPTMFDEPFRTRADGISQTQRFPFVCNSTKWVLHLPVALTVKIQPTRCPIARRFLAHAISSGRPSVISTALPPTLPIRTTTPGK